MMEDIISITNAVVVVIVIIVYRIIKRPRITIENRTALITGGASGIGLETAKQFASLGMNVIIWDKNRSLLEESLEEVKKCLQPGYIVIQQGVDVSNPEEVVNAYKEVKLELEKCNQAPISIVINNAGIVYDHTVSDADIKEINGVFGVNVLSHFYVDRVLLPDLKKQKVANIVSISSLIALLPANHLVSYSSSKAAVLAMNDSLRIELKSTNSDNVRVSTICPQFVDTGMFAGSYSSNHIGQKLVRFFFPPNSAKDVAGEIVYAIRNDKARIILPRLVAFFIPFLAMVPTVIADYIFMFIGSNHGMEGFNGRDKKWNENYCYTGSPCNAFCSKGRNESSIVSVSGNPLFRVYSFANSASG